jgi:amino acid transporter
MASVGALVLDHAGGSSWLSVLAGTVGVCCVGVAVVPFTRRRVAGGALYSYVQHVFGDWARLLVAASLIPGYLAGTMALLGAFGLYAGSTLKSLGVTGAGAPAAQAALYAVAAGTACVLARRGLGASARISTALLALSMPLVLVVMGALASRGGLRLGSQLRLEDFSFHGFSQGLAIGVTFLILFETSSATAAETADPVRTVPRVMMAVPVIVGTANVAATLLTVPALQQARPQLADGVSPLAVLAASAGLPRLAALADPALAVSVFAALTGFCSFAPRVWRTMAVDGLLPSRLAALHTRLRTPTAAVTAMSLAAAAATALLAAVVDGGALAVYRCVSLLFTYLWVIPYVLICVGALALWHRERRLTVARAAAAVLGALTFGWLLPGAVADPPPAPYHLMLWICPAAVAVTLALLVPAHRRRRRTAPVHPPPGAAPRPAPAPPAP